MSRMGKPCNQLTNIQKRKVDEFVSATWREGITEHQLAEALTAVAGLGDHPFRVTPANVASSLSRLGLMGSKQRKDAEIAAAIEEKEAHQAQQPEMDAETMGRATELDAALSQPDSDKAEPFNHIAYEATYRVACRNSGGEITVGPSGAGERYVRVVGANGHGLTGVDITMDWTFAQRLGAALMRAASERDTRFSDF